MNKLAQLITKYRSCELSKSIDYDKFNHYAITHHSTSIEGSTLTEIDTQLLLDEGLTPKGKPLVHSLMTQDHYNALVYIVGEAKKKTAISLKFIQYLNGVVMKSTGKIYNTVLGDVDASKGELRKGNVYAENRYFVNYDKVLPLTEKLVKSLQKN